MINKNKLLSNFCNCKNWEEKYLYIIELGNHLPKIPKSMYSKKNLIKGCQSKVWIIVKIYKIHNFDKVYFYGDSDTSIIKGLIAIIFIIYNNLSPTEVINFNINYFFNKMNIKQNFTVYRTEGLKNIINYIHNQINHCKYNIVHR